MQLRILDVIESETFGHSAHNLRKYMKIMCRGFIICILDGRILHLGEQQIMDFAV